MKNIIFTTLICLLFSSFGVARADDGLAVKAMTGCWDGSCTATPSRQCNCRPNKGVARAEDGLAVKAMTFNIRFNNPKDGPNRWSERSEMAADVIRHFDGDFVGMQEALPDQIADLLGMLPDYRSFGSPRGADDKGGEASPIFYRYDRWTVDCCRQGTFWLSDTPNVPGSITWGNAWPRIVTWARFVEKRSGRGLYVFNTHFDHISALSRSKAAVLLAEVIAARDLPEPVLVTGDFNAGESSEPIEYLTGRQPGSPVRLSDTFRELHPDEKQVGTFHAFKGEPRPDKIDYVFVTPGVEVRSAEIIRFNLDGRHPSDHFPVAAEVVFPICSNPQCKCCCNRLRKQHRERRLIRFCRKRHRAMTEQ